MVVNKAIIGAHQYLAIVAFLHLFLSSIVLEARAARPLLLKNFGSSYEGKYSFVKVAQSGSSPCGSGHACDSFVGVAQSNKPLSPDAKHDEGYNFIKDVKFQPSLLGDRYNPGNTLTKVAPSETSQLSAIFGRQGYTLTNVAQSGPSPRGAGHVQGYTFTNVAQSGPSPRGAGHDTLTNVAQSGPSPRGAGHVQGYTFTNVAQSGPSPRGAGHDQGYTFTNVAQSGPSPRGAGHDDQSITLTKVSSSGPSYSHNTRHVQGYTFIEVAQSGPSPRGAGHDGSYISSEVAQSRPSPHHAGHYTKFFQKPT
nr:protein FAR1-RELATED SEQUENCE 7-like [Ipomoea batatas]